MSDHGMVYAEIRLNEMAVVEDNIPKSTKIDEDTIPRIIRGEKVTIAVARTDEVARIAAEIGDIPGFWKL